MTPDRASEKVICVIGRDDFRTGIGTVTAAALELLSRSMPVEFFPSRTHGAVGDRILLPSGRPIPVAEEARGFRYYFFTDVLWNGASDFNYRALPDDGVKVAHMAYDSDQLPAEWVQILNTNFDLALFSSEYLEEVAERSGVTIPIGTLHIGLDIERLIARRYVRPAGTKLRVGTVTAFHDRKGLDVLIEAFLDEFKEDEEIELVIHSNLSIGATFQRLSRYVADRAEGRVTFSTGDLAPDEKNDLIDSFDIYANVSSGEGYSIGPREALALGKPAVLSDIPPHRELGGIPGVALVPVIGWRPAAYPEIDNRIFGQQAVMDTVDVGRALRTMSEYVRTEKAAQTAHLRKMKGASYSNAALEAHYRAVFDPGAPVRETPVTSDHGSRVPPLFVKEARRVAGRAGRGVHRKKHVIPAHDGGFFSLFNVFASHLAWAEAETSPPMVLPDWDVTRLIERSQGRPLRSYCYSRPEDGNLWTNLFEPLYGLSVSDFNDVEALYEGAEIPTAEFNESKEPLLTYVNAYQLYRAPWFGGFRSQYGSVVRRHVRLLPERQAEIDAFRGRLDGRFLVAVHVKHPSHAVEQPDQVIAANARYLEEVRKALSHRGIAESSDDWAVFVATDQERVVSLFESEFEGRVLRFDDVARVSEVEQKAFDELAEEEKIREGHQLQHLMAADQSNWSVRLAWEVWRDAEALAASNVLIHAVSNVATAASYLGPQVRMVYCDPEM